MFGFRWRPQTKIRIDEFEKRNEPFGPFVSARKRIAIFAQGSLTRATDVNVCKANDVVEYVISQRSRKAMRCVHLRRRRGVVYGAKFARHLCVLLGRHLAQRSLVQALNPVERDADIGAAWMHLDQPL